MLLLLLSLQTTPPPPDIQLRATVQARSVTIEKHGQARLTVQAEPDAGSVVDVQAPPANGRKTIKNVNITVDAKASLADPRHGN